MSSLLSYTTVTANTTRRIKGDGDRFRVWPEECRPTNAS